MDSGTVVIDVIEPGTILDRYVMLRPLATGGMGEVYLARLQGAAGFDSFVAIKVLISSVSTKPAFVAMFLDEARNVARVRHPNIVQIRDIDLRDGQYFMVMEYIRGHNLRELLGDVSILDMPLFTPRLGANTFAELASALAAIHAAGLVHRDLSPNNIMISDEGVVKIIDFGVARALGNTSLTTPGTLKGKFTYMAPEYVRGQPYDHRLDIFSFGVVMWETFARRRLFRGTNAAEQLHQVLEAKIPRLDEAVPGFPSDLADLVAGMLERDPERRLADASTIADRLRDLARGYTEAGDRTLEHWLTRRVGSRIQERLRRDQQSIEGVSSDLPIVEVRSSGSASGSGPARVEAEAVGVGSTSIRIANGEAMASHPPPRRRGIYVILAGSVIVLALVAGIAIRRGGESSSPTTAAEIRAPATATIANSDGERHRRSGIDALGAKDYQRAISELAEAIRLGVRDPAVLQLMELARKLKRESAGSAVQMK